MVIGELFNLIGLAKTFADGKRQLDRAFFDDFIEPAWVTFSKIHEQYEKSLQQYNLLLQEGTSVWELTGRMSQDILYSASLRIELGQLVKHNLKPHRRIKGKREELLHTFFKTLLEYFNSRRGFQTVWEVDSETGSSEDSAADMGYAEAKHELDNPRTVIVGYLKLLDQNTLNLSPEQITNIKNTVRSSFDRMVAFLQERYAAVASAYYALRTEMLK